MTWVMDETMKSPFASDSEDRPIATCIYYLLCHKAIGCPDKPRSDGSAVDPFKTWSSDLGVFHLNKSSTMHVHHAGRTKYTLISAKQPLGKGLVDERGSPLTKTVVMGDDIARGEARQLLVEGGWWKVSEIPLEDRTAVQDGAVDGSNVGALISEVVTPGESRFASATERSLTPLLRLPLERPHVSQPRQAARPARRQRRGRRTI